MITIKPIIAHVEITVSRTGTPKIVKTTCGKTSSIDQLLFDFCFERIGNIPKEKIPSQRKSIKPVKAAKPGTIPVKSAFTSKTALRAQRSNAPPITTRLAVLTDFSGSLITVRR
jgi:hypothetical protein